MILVMNMLETLFGSKSSGQVLTFLVLHGEGYASRIAHEGGISLFAVQQQLAKFEAAGILVSHTSGRKRIYGFNPRYPLLDPLRRLVQQARSRRTRPSPSQAPVHLPQSLREFFWDYRFDQLSWGRDRDLVIRRLLTVGSWDSILWLRRQIGDAALRDWIIARRGRGLTARQLRFWALVLNLPQKQIDVWVKQAASNPWSAR